MAKISKISDLDRYYHSRIKALCSSYPFILYVTTLKKYQGPVLIIKEIIKSSVDNDNEEISLVTAEENAKKHIEDMGFMTGEPLRRCMNIIKRIVGEVRDMAGIPLELQKFITPDGLNNKYRYPLDEEAGAKLSLIFKLQCRVKEIDRIELIARRILRFTREESTYWLSRTTTFGDDANRWAVSGLRIMLAGEAQDPGIPKMLEQLKELD